MFLSFSNTIASAGESVRAWNNSSMASRIATCSHVRIHVRRRICVYIHKIYRFTKLKQKLGANRVPFLLPSQAWYKILSLSRARQDRSGEPRAFERGDTDGERERKMEGGMAERGGRERRTKRQRTVPLSRERKTGKRSPAKGPRYAAPFPYHSFASFFFPLPLSFIRLFSPLPSPPPLTPPPPLCAARLVELYLAPLCSGACPPPPALAFKSAFEILKPRRASRRCAGHANCKHASGWKACNSTIPRNTFLRALFIRAPSDGAGHSDLYACRRVPDSTA